MELVTVLIALMVYFMPTLIARRRHHHNIGAIFVVNLFGGWTVLMWFVALAMASGYVRKAGDR